MRPELHTFLSQVAHRLTQNTQYTLCLVGTFAAVALSTPFFRAFAHRIGMVDHPGGQTYKWHHSPTALLGGVTIIVAVVLSLVAGHRAKAEVVVIMLGALLCAAVGLIDDRRALGAVAKFAPTMAGALGLWAVGVRANFTGSQPVDFAITVLWVVGATHAVNIIDNMDGVAVGLSAISAAGFFFVAASTSQTRVALLAIAVLGACLGFLPFNYRLRADVRASMFLGDAGTLFLGFVLASLALAIDLPGSSVATRMAMPALLLAVPLFNVALVVISRYRGGRPIMTGGTDGTAHRLVTLGLRRVQATLVFWGVGAVLAVFGTFAARFEPTAAWLALAATTIAAAVALWFFERVDLTATTASGDGDLIALSDGGAIVIQLHDAGQVGQGNEPDHRHERSLEVRSEQRVPRQQGTP